MDEYRQEQVQKAFYSLCNDELTEKDFDRVLEAIVDDSGNILVDSEGKPIFADTVVPTDQYNQLQKNIERWETLIQQEEEQLALLEKQSTLAKRSRKYRRFDPAETWCSHWVVYPIACLLPAKEREEWLGDLLELHREMLHQGRPRWFVNLIDVGQVITRLISALQIKVSDFISSAIGRRS